MLIVVVVSTQSPTLERRQLCVVAGRPGSFTVVDSVIKRGGLYDKETILGAQA